MNGVRLFLLLALMGLCAGAARAEDAVAAGERLFNRNCAICHAPGLTGAFMLERRNGKESAILAARTDHDPSYVYDVVRNGLGSMPPVTRVEITDSDLAAIAGYLTRPMPAPEQAP